MYHLLILNVARESWFQTSTCSLIVFNSFFVLYLMCCFGNNPLYMDFTPTKILFCFVLYSLHGAYNVYCQTKTCCRAWHNPYCCLHLTWNPESLSWPSICVQGVKGFDTIHIVVYTLHETLNLFPDPPSVYKVLKGLTQPILLFIPYMEHRNPLHWSPVSIQGVEGFEIIHTAILISSFCLSCATIFWHGLWPHVFIHLPHRLQLLCNIF